MPRSDRSKAGFSPRQLIPFLQTYPARGRIWVALSGGVDSTVLLHALSQLQLDAPLHAVHVNHGLQSAAEDWVVHCRQLCQQLKVPLVTITVDAKPAEGESPEAVARHARYRAFESQLSDGDQVFTAHHQQDQAETFLLRALRGSGPRGLAAMRPARPLGVGQLLRPLLEVSQQALIDYAEAQQLSWVEDPSNQWLDADRNFLRRQILPLLNQRWPAAAATLSRSSVHCAEADQLQQQWGRNALGELAVGEPLPLYDAETAQQLKLRIRSWLDLNQVDPPDTVHMSRILDEVVGARKDATPLVSWRNLDGALVRLRRFQRALYLQQSWGEALFESAGWNLQQPLALTENRQLIATPAQGAGISATSLKGRTVTIRWRSGGERCCVAGGKQRRTLKNLLREAAIPPWERERTPLLYIGDELAAVVGYFICEPFVAAEGEEGVWVEIAEGSFPGLA